MEYYFRNEENVFKAGNYYIDATDRISQVIFDSDRGYALLNITTGELESDFYEDMDSFIRFTTILMKKEVVLVNVPEFKLK